MKTLGSQIKALELEPAYLVPVEKVSAVLQVVDGDLPFSFR
jgi:hypothetical protein